MSDNTTQGQPEGSEWATYIATIFGHGDAEILSLSGEDFDEALRLQAVPERDRFGQHYLRIGEFLSSAASLEGQMLLVASFLLNPTEPGRATPALRTLSAKNRSDLASALLQPRWHDTAPVFREVADIAAMRNQVAHNGLSDLRVDAAGRLDSSVHLAIGKFTKDGFVTDRVGLSLPGLDAWIQRANLANKVLLQVLFHLAAAQFRHEAFPADIALDLVLVEPGDTERPLFTAADRAVFIEKYRG